MKLQFVCRALPGPGDECVFVELENEQGRSLAIGEWETRPDGLVALVIDTDESAGRVTALEATNRYLEEARTARAEVKRLSAILAALHVGTESGPGPFAQIAGRFKRSPEAMAAQQLHHGAPEAVTWGKEWEAHPEHTSPMTASRTPHPDQISPMTVGPEEFFERPEECGICHGTGGKHNVGCPVDISELEAEVIAIDMAMNDTERLDWLEREHTLHGAVEFLYVVDGYTAQRMRDGNPYGPAYRGKDLRTAIDATIARVHLHPEVVTAQAPESAAEDWEGLDCYCGGGWKVGHATGCPEDTPPEEHAKPEADISPPQRLRAVKREED